MLRDRSNDARMVGVATALLAALLLAVQLPVAAMSSVTTPVPPDPPLAPPPIAAMPAADAEVPPAGLIADPVTPEAVCGSWALRSTYGGQWATNQTWWEFSCEHSWFHCPQNGGMCNADLHSNDHDSYFDHFVFDGTAALFYGERHEYYFYADFEGAWGCDLWWDQAQAQWFVTPGPFCQYGQATPPPDPSAPPSPPTSPSPRPSPTPTPNQPPTAFVVLQCTGLACHFDGSGSADPDGILVSSAWDFGDGRTAPGMLADHAYDAYATYRVGLSIEDDDHATASTSKALTLVGLQARTSRVRGQSRVELSWTGAAGASFVVYRDGNKLATTTGQTYLDTPLKRTRPWTYQVCQEGMSICSATVAVTV